jgi:glucose/arabinose dehydrogenase
MFASKTLSTTSLAMLLLCSTATMAQQAVEFSGGIPVAPTGLEENPLGDGPWTYRTAENMDIRVEVVAHLEYAMALTFLPDTSILVVTRRGEMFRIAGGTMRQVQGGPPSVFRGESGAPGTVHGYIDIALHPDFDNNNLIYLTYTKAMPDGGTSIALGRGTWTGSSITGFEDIWGGMGETGGTSRIAFTHDGKIVMTTSTNGPNGDPQDINDPAGKVLRLNDDGSIPADNPFAGRADARGEVYSYGHRGALGLAIHPATGAIWQNENGPNGGDEINVIEPGLNYGWPLVSLGRSYQGPWQAEAPSHEGFQPPVVYWMPAIAVSGMTFYTGDALPRWQGNVFVGSMRTGEIPGTGHLERIVLNENMEELRRESLLVDLRKRVRDVQQGPDGFLYVALEERDGGVLRIRPAP